MKQINISDVKALVQAVAIDTNMPVMIWGSPGVGKSEAMQQVADDNNAILVDIRLSQFDSTDLRGTPWRNLESNTTQWCPVQTLPLVGVPGWPTDRLIVLFFDEINAASPSVSAAAYQIINDKRIGEFHLMPNVRIVAAGNREGDRGVANRMPTPLANRFVHCEATVSLEDWTGWAQDNGIDPMMLAFVHFRPALLNGFDPALPAKAFPTPRTVAKAAHLHSKYGSKAISLGMIEGACGTGFAAEFNAFVTTCTNLPDIAAIIADPSTAKLPDGPAQSYAVSVALSGAMTLKTTPAIAVYLARLEITYSALAWVMAVRRDKTLVTKEYVAFATRHSELFVG